MAQGADGIHWHRAKNRAGEKVDYDFITDGSKRHKKAPVADQKQVSGDGRMLKRLSNEPAYFTVSSIMARVAPSMLRQ